jgi:hypothetical protein
MRKLIFSILVLAAVLAAPPAHAEQSCYQDDAGRVTLHGVIKLVYWDRSDLGDVIYSPVLVLDAPICFQSECLGRQDVVHEIQLVSLTDRLPANIPYSGRHEVTGKLYAACAGSHYCRADAMDVLNVDGVRLADRTPVVLEGTPIDFVHRYYFDLGRGNVAGVLARWKKPDEPHLRKLMAEVESTEVSAATVLEGDDEHAIVAVEVTIKLREKPAEHWRGVIELVQVAGRWKIERMRDFQATPPS